MQQDKETKFTYTADPKLNKAHDECFYEAEKLLLSAPPRTAYGYAAKTLYKDCMRLKGYGD